MDDEPSAIGCTEAWEMMSEKRRSDPSPEDDLDDCFFDAPPSDAPFDAVAEDPILRGIGNTPIVPHPENEQIVCKMEKYNPTLSHKDRLGAGMVVALRESGQLSEGQRVVEASSGNTAGGVALAANRLGHPCTIVLRNKTDGPKRGFVRSLDANVVTAPNVGHENPEYYQKVAKDYAEEHDAVLVNQYERELNRAVHNQWTGPELWRQIEGEGVTHIVAAMSTGGTISGIAEYINQQTNAIEFIGVDGNESNVHRVFNDEERGEYDVDVDGLGQWRVTESANLDAVDDVMTVSDSVARSRAKHEASDNGLLIGPSSGAVVEAAQQIARDDASANVLCFIHDGAVQYFGQVDGW